MIGLTRPDCPHPAALQGGNYKHPLNKGALIESTHGKCMYCESRCTHVYPGDVEHIKPKQKFPALEFDWKNLGFACSVCNNSKNDYYYDDAQLLDPYTDNPENFVFADGPFIYPLNGNTRGRSTINVLTLNRSGLLSNRMEKLREIERLLETIMCQTSQTLKRKWLKDLESLATGENEYSFVLRQALNRIIPTTLETPQGA